jgi:PAS domain-containing protein
MEPLAHWDLARAGQALLRLRASLRPESVESEPPRAPFINVWSPGDRLLRASANVEEHIGWDAAYLRRLSPGLHLFRPGDAEFLYPFFYRCLMGQPQRGVEYRLMHADGRGYVWFADEMVPVRRAPDRQVREVYIRSHNLTAIRAREIDFILECLRLFRPRRDTRALEDLGVPALLASLLPGRCTTRPGRVIPFRLAADRRGPIPGMEPALSDDFRGPRLPSR